MTARTVKGLSDQSVLCAEVFAYDAAGNFTDAEDSDTSGRLAVLGGSVSVAKNGYDNIVSPSIELNHKLQNSPPPKLKTVKNQLVIRKQNMVWTILRKAYLAD